MSDASVFRTYAEEALRNASTTGSEEDKRALEDLACTWAKAALASDKIFGSSANSWPRGVDETS
jgi:hypothetical protein